MNISFRVCVTLAVVLLIAGCGFGVTPAVKRREAAEVDDWRFDREEIERFAGQAARRFVKRHEARLSTARLAAPFGMASSVYGYAYKDK